MIHKSFLRILMCNLLSYKQDNQYATIAEDRVYDTALEDLDARGSHAPCILIYTDNSSADLNGQNPNYIATYFNVKLKIELIVFGGYSGFGQYVNDDRFLSIILDIFEQQVFDAIFKSQNELAQDIRDKIVFKSDFNVVTSKESDSDTKILISTLDVDIQLPIQYTNIPYSENAISVLDYYPEYADLIPIGIKNELQKILAIKNISDKIEIINTQFPMPTVTIETDND